MKKMLPIGAILVAVVSLFLSKGEQQVKALPIPVAFFQNPASEPPESQPLIDAVGVAAYRTVSLNRLMRTAYGDTSNIMRIRRSSDNAEANIPMVGGLTDRSAMTTHVGAGDGFLVTAYDQSGNARNYAQSTASAQPLIVDDGVILVDSDDKIIARFDGVNDYLVGAGSVDDSARISTFGVFNNVSLTLPDVVVGITSAGGFDRIGCRQKATVLEVFDTGDSDDSAAISTGTFYLVRLSFDSTTSLMQINDATAVSFASSIGFVAFEEFYIGAINDFETVGTFANIEFSEQTEWWTDSIGAGQVTTAKDNIYAFYGAITP